MEVFTDKELMRRWSRQVRLAGETVALVPTMGALHEGHLRLVELAAREADRVVVSIYVNPTQFDRAEDLAKYPRTLHSDLKALEGSSCKAVFAPTEMYLPGSATWVTVDGLTDHLCGRTRPGHFRGVTTIVAKFLHVVEPDVAIFGNKDYQQRRVQVRLQREGDGERLILADDGQGVAPDRRADLQAALDAQDYEGRMGLGLMLTDLVVRAHGGRLNLPAAQRGFVVELVLGPAPQPGAGAPDRSVRP